MGLVGGGGTGGLAAHCRKIFLQESTVFRILSKKDNFLMVEGLALCSIKYKIFITSGPWLVLVVKKIYFHKL